MARIAITARPRGVDHVLRRFGVAAGRLPLDTLEAQRELGRRSEVSFAAHAPFKTGRLIRGISSQESGSTIIVKDEARNPESGYDYVGVTRFGVREARIYPKHRFASVVLATRKRRKGELLTHGYDSFVDGRPALRFTIGGRVLYRASVAGYHPDHDWAEDALPEVQAQAQVVASRLGETITARF